MLLKDQARASRDNLVFLCLAAATLIVYGRVWNCGFVNYDDQIFVYQNPTVTAGLTTQGIVWALRTTFHDFWHPLTWWSHMLDCELFGLAPGYHHLVNLAFHIAITLLLYSTLQKITGAWKRSALVAALFALHPLHVESVAWIAERKDVLSTFFWMLTIWAYVRSRGSRVEASSPGYAALRSRGQDALTPSLSHPMGEGGGTPGEGSGSSTNRALDPRRSTLDYFLAVAFFALALMAKAMVVTLPFVLLLLDYWPLRRMQFGRGVFASLRRPEESRSRPADEGNNRQPTTNIQHPKGEKEETGTSRPHSSLAGEGWGEGSRPSTLNQQPTTPLRLLVEKVPFFLLSLISSVMTYAGMKSLHNVFSTHQVPWAFRIANTPVSYVRYLFKLAWPTDLVVFYPSPDHWAVWEVAGAVVVLLIISGLAVALARKAPYFIVGWLLFLGTLVPVIGLVSMSYQSLADRYMYVPSIGLFIAAVWGAGDLAKRIRLSPVLVNAAAGLVLIACGALTWAQVGHWRDSLSLWTHALKINSSNAVAHYGLACALRDDHRPGEAIPEYVETLRLQPDHLQANLDLGCQYYLAGNIQEATNYFVRALRIKPDYFKAHGDLGLALLDLKSFGEASNHFAQALRIDPRSGAAHRAYGQALLGLGNFKDAIAACIEAVRLDPRDFAAWKYEGDAFGALGDSEQSLKCYYAALQLNPGYAEAHCAIGLEWMKRGNFGAAISSLEEALRLKPDLAEARAAIEQAKQKAAGDTR